MEVLTDNLALEPLPRTFPEPIFFYPRAIFLAHWKGEGLLSVAAPDRMEQFRFF